MKRALVFLGVAAFLAVPAANGASSAVDLAKAVKALQGQVKSLQKEVAALKATQKCNEVVIPVAVFGDRSGQEAHGYLYQDRNNAIFKTTALDYVSSSSDQPDWWLVTSRADCVSRAAARPGLFHPALLSRVQAFAKSLF